MTQEVKDFVQQGQTRFSSRQIETPEFKKWFKASQVVDSEGNPLVVYHGTTHTFTKFTTKRGNPEGHYGKGFYFTNSIADVNNNYAGEGPDLTSRISSRAEEIVQEYEDNGKTITYEKALQKARKELVTHQGAVMPVYISIQNPVETGLGRHSTVLAKKDWYNEDGELTQDTPFVTGLFEAFEKAADNVDMYPPYDDFKSRLYQELEETDIIYADDFEKILRENITELNDDDIWISDIISDVYKNMGFDGIIQKNVVRTFRMMRGTDTNTIHYIVFDSTQIKSATGNKGTFNETNPDIRYSNRMIIPERGEERERGLSANIATNNNMHIDLQRAFGTNPLIYNQMKNKDTLDVANTRFAAITDYDQAYVDFLADIDSFDISDVPYGMLLANHFAGANDMNKAEGVVAALAERLTQAGRFAQASIILRDSGNPAFMIRTLKMQLKKLNVQGLKKYGANWKNIELLPAEEAALRASFIGAQVNQIRWDAALEAIHNRILSEMPVTLLEKLNAWRRMSMLTNFKTHIRNVMGNVVMLFNSKLKDVHATVLERLFVRDKTQWAHALLWKNDARRVAVVNQHWQKVKNDLQGVHKYEVGALTAFQREKRIFKTELLEKWNKGVVKALDMGDMPFMALAFKRALGMEMKVKNTYDVTEAMIINASNKAMEDTFKQLNQLSKWLKHIKQEGGMAGFLTEAAIPFERTPAAIAKLAFEYSPMGIVPAFVSLFRTGKDPSQTKKAVEQFAKALTGAELVALGLWLALLGLISGARDDTKKERELLKNLGGIQDFAINTPWGTYTYDWLQPAAVPVAIGATIGARIIKMNETGEAVDGAALLEAALAGSDTLFNLSMLRNIKDILGGSYESITESIANIPLDYLEQGHPTLLGAIARSVDPVRKNTRTGGFFENYFKGIAAKTPGLSQTVVPQVDIFGRDVLQNTVGGTKSDGYTAGNVAAQFLSPGYYLGKPQDPVDKELVRLYSALTDAKDKKDVLPTMAPKKVSYDNKTLELTAEEQVQFQRELGQLNYKGYKALINTTRYKDSADELKVIMVENLFDVHYRHVKQQFLLKNLQKLK